MSLGATFDRNNAGGGGAGSLISALNRAVNHAEQRGTLVVSAAGNDGLNLNGRLFEVPAQSGHGMAVSATGPLDFAILGNSAPFDRLASYSNYGQSVVNVAAPGGDEDPALIANPVNKSPVCKVGNSINFCFVFDLVISPGGFTVDSKGNVAFLYFFAAGTSMATPHVSGEAALIVGKYGHMNPSILRSIIEGSADNIGSNAFFGRGRINAIAALQ